MSWLSLGLGLAVSIFRLGLCIIQLRMKEIVALVTVRLSSQYFPDFGLYIIQYARRTSWLSQGLGLAVSIFSLGLHTIQLRKKEIVALVMVRVSRQYFPVWDCINYRTVHKKDFVALARVRVISRYFPVWNCIYNTLRKKDALALTGVRVSSQYFLVLDCVSYSCARKRSWLSLWLGLAVSILQFWIVYRTVCKMDFVALARVRVSSQYFQVRVRLLQLECYAVLLWCHISSVM